MYMCNGAHKLAHVRIACMVCTFCKPYSAKAFHFAFSYFFWSLFFSERVEHEGSAEVPGPSVDATVAQAQRSGVCLDTMVHAKWTCMCACMYMCNGARKLVHVRIACMVCTF
jgi:hypothetical protein